MPRDTMPRGIPCRAPPCGSAAVCAAKAEHCGYSACQPALCPRVPSRHRGCGAQAARLVPSPAVPGQCRTVCCTARRKGEREGVRSRVLGRVARERVGRRACRSSSCSAPHSSTSNPKSPTSPGAAPRPLSVMGPPQPHLHRDWAHPCHIRTGTGLTRATSAPGLHAPLPHPHRDWAHPIPHLRRDCADPSMRAGTAHSGNCCCPTACCSTCGAIRRRFPYSSFCGSTRSEPSALCIMM